MLSDSETSKLREWPLELERLDELSSRSKKLGAKMLFIVGGNKTGENTAGIEGE